jgi:hypothetical protein
MTDTSTQHDESNIAPPADSNGEAITSIDGLCFIGTVLSVEQVKSGDRILPNLANVTVAGTKTTERITASRYERTLNGDIPLAAFDKLVYGVGKTFCISLGGVPYVAKNGKAYTNYTAIDAVLL